MSQKSNTIKVGFVILSLISFLFIISSVGPVAANEAPGTENLGSKPEAGIPDKVPPLITVEGAQDGAHYPSDVRPVVKVSDEHLTNRKITLNGSAYDGAPVTRDGSYTLKIEATDLSGNRSSKSLTFVVDKTPPALTVEGVQDGKFYSADVRPVVKVSDEHISSRKITLNGSAYDGAPVVRDGNYTLKIEAADLSDNRSSKSLTFVIDKVPPAISIAGIEDGRYYNSEVLPVIAVSDSNIKEKKVTLNGRTYSGAEISEEGSFELKIDAVDMAGNKSSLIRHFYIDRTSPVATLQLGRPIIADDGKVFVTGSTPVSLTSSDAGAGSSGVSSVEYSLDGASSWNIYKKNVLLGSREGPRKISYRSTDNAGNVEAAKQSEVTVDNSAPLTLINAGEPKLPILKGGSLLVNRGTEFTLKASDNYSGTAKTEYRISNGQWTAKSSFNMVNDGRQLIEYRSIDRLGNTETAKSLDVIVDNTAPVSTLSFSGPKLSASNNRSFITGATVITFSARDALSEVATTEYRIDGGAWAAFAPVKLQAEGEHLIEYRSRDQIGNLEEIKSTTLIIDNTPPVTGISTGIPHFTSLDGALFATGRTLLAFSASDSGSGVAKTEYKIDNGVWTQYSVPFSVPAEGKHLITYRSIDNTGNQEPLNTMSITIDNKPPLTTINIGKPKYETAGTLFVAGNTTVSLTSTDNLSGLKKSEYRINNGEWTVYGSSIDLSSFPDGKGSITYRSFDNLENLESEKVLMIVIDNAPPFAKVNLNTPSYTSANGVNYVTTMTSLTLNVTDALCGVMKAEYRLDNGQWLVNSPFRISSEGSHVIESRNSDNLGNVETSKTFSVTVDNTPPVTKINIGPPKYEAGGDIFITGKTEFAFNATDSLSGINKSQYRINGGEWTVYTGAFNFKSVAEGKQTIGYRSVDNLGNIETENTLSVIVDNTPPSTMITVSDPRFTSVNDVTYVTSVSTFSLTSRDNLSGVKISEYRVDSGQWTPAAKFRINSEGSHKVGYRSIDNIGNVETEKIISVTVDNTPPITGIASKAIKYKAGGTIYATSKTEFTLHATDNLSGVKETDYRIDISAWVTGITLYTLSATENSSEVKMTEYKTDSSAWSTGTTLTLPIDGTHTIGYRSRDNVENLEAEKTLTVIIDNIPPYTTIDFSLKYNDGKNLLVSKNSQVTLNASDGLSGVKATYYRYDNEKDWRPYSGPFEPSDLSNGMHTIYYKSVDNVDNSENDKSITIKTIGRD